MKKCRSGSSWFFVDESGDPTFYDAKGRLIVGQPGCSPVLIVGLIETQQPQTLRDAVLALQHEIVNDPQFQNVPSIKRSTAVAFHAKDDIPEVRDRFFELIAALDFRTQIFLARKHEESFRNNFQANGNLFYDHLISRLFQNVLHRYEQNYIFFARRGTRERQAPLTQAIHHAKAAFEAQFGAAITSKLHVQAQWPSAEPCLSIIDYMNWAVYRTFTKRDMSYYRLVEDRVSLLVDLYDNQWYSRKNRFDIEKATPL